MVGKFKAKETDGALKERVQTLKVIRDFPEEMNDQEALVLMLSVHCTADVVGLSVDPTMTGSQVRAVIDKYRAYYTNLKGSANDVLRSILEDGTMIALGRIRSAVCRVPLTTVNEVKLMLSVMIELKKMAELMPKKIDYSVSGAEADRFEKLKKKVDILTEGSKDSLDSTTTEWKPSESLKAGWA